MWVLLLAGFAVAGLFGVDEAVNPEKYPEQSEANGIHYSSPAPAKKGANNSAPPSDCNSDASDYEL